MRHNKLAISKEEIADMLTSDLFWEHKFISIPVLSGPVIFWDHKQNTIVKLMESLGKSYEDVLREDMQSPNSIDFTLFEVFDEVNRNCIYIEDRVAYYSGIYLQFLADGNIIIYKFGNEVNRIPWKDYQKWRIRNYILSDPKNFSGDYEHRYAEYLKELSGESVEV